MLDSQEEIILEHIIIGVDFYISYIEKWIYRSYYILSTFSTFIWIMQKFFETKITFVFEITFIEPALATCWKNTRLATSRNVIMLTTGE